jgi:transketolase
MVDNKSKDDITTTTTKSTEAASLYDTVRQNYIRILDEFTKAQPQYTQSVSNLQLDYIAATKNTIQNMISAQKMLASNGNVPIVTPPYADEFVKQSNEITENIVRAVRINNQLTVNAINAAAENFRTLNRTIESVTEFNTSAAKAWNSFVTVQQQQFLHKE